MTKKDAIDVFEAAGWKQYANPFSRDAVLLAKRFDSKYRCSWNRDKNGLQVCAQVYEPDAWGHRIKIELRAGLPNGDSASLELFGYRDPVRAIDAAPMLVKAFEGMAGECNQQPASGSTRSLRR